MFDSHVHSAFSHDGKSTINEYVDFLNAHPSKEIGFSEHVDYTPDGSGYGCFDYNNYRKTVTNFQDNGIRIFSGAEVGYHVNSKNQILAALSKQSYDFTICSVHRVLGYSLSTNRNLQIFKDADLFKRILNSYYLALEDCLTIPEFDVMGHIGIYRRYLNDDFFDQQNTRRLKEDLELTLATHLAKTEKIVEINTSGLFSPCQAPFPDFSFLQHYYNHGGRRICIGSDSHSVTGIFGGFEAITEKLKTIGFTYLTKPWNQQEEKIE
jgi:histidinol-phosphatase (PHP family)